MNEQQERVAQAIYRKMPGSEAHPWVEGGNSLKQDEARAYARAALEHLRCDSAQGVPADSLEVTAQWQAFGRTEDFRRAVKWAQDGEVPGALFVAFRAGLQSTPAPAQAQQAEAKPLTHAQIIGLLYPIYDGLPSLTPITDTKVARAVERACAEKWGVKLAGIGANSGSAE